MLLIRLHGSCSIEIVQHVGPVVKALCLHAKDIEHDLQLDNMLRFGKITMPAVYAPILAE